MYRHDAGIASMCTILIGLLFLLAVGHMIKQMCRRHDSSTQKVEAVGASGTPACFDSSGITMIQGGSNMTGTDLYVNKPHCAAAVRP